MEPSTPPKLLIADDDPVVRSALSLGLEHQFEIVGAVGDATAALHTAQSEQPDVALIDVQMPGGGARTAVPAIARECPQTAVVVLSGDESDALVRELMIAGATTYVRKGIGAFELAQVLHRSIRAVRA